MALIKSGYRVICLSPFDDYVKKLQGIGAEWQPLEMDRKGANPAKDIRLLVTYLRRYFQIRPAIALNFTVKNNIYGALAARVCGIPAISNVTGLGTSFVHFGLISIIVQHLYRISQKYAQIVFCQNQEDLDLLREYKLVQSQRLRLLPGSGVDLERFNPRLRITRPKGKPLRLLYAGRMLYDKGLKELMDAMGRINLHEIRCELTLAGSSGAENRSAVSESELSEWGMRAWVKLVPHTDNMPALYAQADAVVLPSYREGMPRTLLEAGAMALPVVTTNVPGCRQLISHGVNGIVCDPRSAEALCDALEMLLALSDDERDQYGAAGRKRVEEQFDEVFVVRSTMTAIKELLS